MKVLKKNTATFSLAAINDLNQGVFLFNHNMNWLLFLLSVIFFPYGISFTQEMKLIIKFIPYLLFILSIFDQIHMMNENFKGSFIGIFCYFVYLIGYLTYSFVMFIRGKKLASTIMENIHLLNRKQYKLILICSSLLILNAIILDAHRLITSVIPVIIKLINHYDKRNIVELFIVTARFLSLPYYFWTAHSAFIYGLVYLLMHLKQMKFFSSLENIKNHTYSIWFNVLTCVQFDYENFDKLLSVVPTSWIFCIFINTSPLLQRISSINFPTLAVTVQDYVSWPIALFCIHKLHSSFEQKIDQIIFTIVMNDSLSDLSKDQFRKLLKQTRNCYVTACFLFRLDKSFVLPFLGSLFTFSIIFKENFELNLAFVD